MEEVHQKHKDAAWGWLAVILAVLDGFPKRRTRTKPARRRSATVVTPWSQHSPSGWSA
ncbi:hypothetical protein [Brevundimonas sp.]|uniref:hypothetical protein n=1 Tax=Brevundimonas sp. TaxID=1871086 RepID=UPI00286A9C4F|nr:hypothetical protein [Brevundimonas sp.]